MSTGSNIRIIFVYAGDPDNGEIRSPYTITRNLCRFLRTKAEVVYRDWTSHGPLEIRPDDIFLGHPNYPTNTITQWVFNEGPPCKAKCLIHPLHTALAADNLPFDPLARKADAIFSIMGRYWHDTLDASPFASWKPKITRVDMAVDASHFPYLKTSFNPIGRRRLVYIGSDTPNKNLGFLVSLMSAMPDIELHWYGGSSGHPLARLPNVKTTGHVTLNGDWARKITTECDVFISTSSSDANPTTLLETSAWGLIPIATPQSGYYASDDGLVDNLDLNDLGGSVRAIRALLVTPESDLVARSLRSRALVETKYNWDVFCDTIWTRLKDFV